MSACETLPTEVDGITWLP